MALHSKERFRDTFIDRIRVSLTALVIFHHTAITYGASGGWFYREVPESSQLSSLLLTFFCTLNQSYFMGLFFFVSGYYTPESLDKKGYLKFLLDRFIRLGVPLLFFAFVLGPFTIWIAQLHESASFLSVLRDLWVHRRFINGPLWFSEALLLFTSFYCCFRYLRVGRKLRIQKGLSLSPIPSHWTWFLSILGVGFGSLMIRQFVRVGENVFGLQLGYFSSYILLFFLGIVAKRKNWLRRLNWSQVRPWVGVSVFALPLMPLAILAVRRYQVPLGDFLGGVSFASILYAFWEPVFAWGVMAGGLLWFRKNANSSSGVWSHLARRAYLIFIIHPVILVGISVLLKPWHASSLVKFSIAGTLACILCWGVAEILIYFPGVRKLI